MTVVDTDATITVEDGAAILRGTLVPYDEATVVGDRRPDGKTMLYAELFDADSVNLANHRGRLPVLLSHDESRPVGRVLNLRHATHGLQLEAELIGSDGELDGMRRRIGAGLLAGLSVGFIADSSADEWTAPHIRDGLPTVRRRNVRVREASVVQWPAYAGAAVDSIRLRTETHQWVHEKMQENHARSEQVKAELNQFNERHRRQVVVEPEPAPPATKPPPSPSRHELSRNWSAPVVIGGVTLPTAPSRSDCRSDADYERRMRDWAADAVTVCDRIDRAAERNQRTHW